MAWIVSQKKEQNPATNWSVSIEETYHVRRQYSWCFVRLPSQSDPVLVGYRRNPFYERCGQSGHTVRTKCCRAENQDSLSTLNIDNLISSLIILQM